MEGPLILDPAPCPSRILFALLMGISQTRLLEVEEDRYRNTTEISIRFELTVMGYMPLLT